jgi:TonB family protein
MLDADLNELDYRLGELLAEEDQSTGFWTIWRGIAAAALIIITVGSLIILKQDKPLPSKLLTENNEPVQTDSITKSKSKNTFADTTQETKSKSSDDKLTAKPESAKSQYDDLEETLVAENEIEIDLNLEKIEPDLIELIKAESLTQHRSDSVSLTIPMNKMDARLEQSLARKDVAELLQSRIAASSIESQLASSAAMADPTPKTDIAKVSVTGVVKGADDGLPLPQVSILKEGTIEGTNTDINGKFELKNIPTNSTLSFRYLGYVTQEVLVDSSRTLEINLEPDYTALGEVVVSGYSEASKKDLTTSYTAAKPIDGYPNFNRYLKDNLEYPEEARAENIKGRVTVEFTVEADGLLTNFEIIKGLGFGCDEEAIRLIKEGPQWQARTQGANQTPVSSQVKVRIRFRP